jgi:hypothetical protein
VTTDVGKVKEWKNKPVLFYLEGRVMHPEGKIVRLQSAPACSSLTFAEEKGATLS